MNSPKAQVSIDHVTLQRGQALQIRVIRRDCWPIEEAELRLTRKGLELFYNGDVKVAPFEEWTP